MGFGYLESVYEKCLLIELSKANFQFESQKRINVFYENQPVGEFKADILVEEAIIVELKSVRHLVKVHEIQLVNYSVATGKPLGLLINFGQEKGEVRRKVKKLSQNGF